MAMDQLNAYILHALSLALLGLNILSFILKRDKQDKIVWLPLGLPAALGLYIVLMPALAAGRGTDLTSFELQAVAWQAAALFLGLLSRLDGQAGYIGFWLASILNLGTSITLLIVAARLG